MSEDPLSLVNCTSADPDAVLGSQRVNELRVLKVANSSLYAFRREVDSLVSVF